VRLTDVAGRRLLVLGAGIDTVAALPALLAAGPGDVTVVDQRPEDARRALAVAGLAHLPLVESLEGAPPADVAMRSPGWSPYAPDVEARVADGLELVTPLGLWLNERGDRPSVAITGTKGKSSTSVLARLALERLGHRAVVLGNIGVPPWGHEPTTELVPVLEVSSYQAAGLPVAAAVAGLTALGEDHVSWHGSPERYWADKARLFTAPLVGPGPRQCLVPEGVHLSGALVDVPFVRVPVPPEDLRASNAHLAAALALALDVVVDPADPGLAELAAGLLDSYPDLPGRFSTVATVDGADYVDDALASAPLGLAAALRTLADRPVIAIVGGADRGAAIEPVLAAAEARTSPTTVVWIDDGGELAAALAPLGVAVVAADDLEQAVQVAARAASPGSTVVFSPAMPTPADQGTWADRSARFRAAVAALRG
jgi:UDP-N-acetylmuramoyl-L-alanine---L-glutamate ligase